MDMRAEAAVLEVPATLDRETLRAMRNALDAVGAAPGGAGERGQTLALPQRNGACRGTTPCGGVVLVRGEPDVFCVGLDLETVVRADRADLLALLDECAHCLARLCTLHVATVAVVTGRASGGGLGLLAACDHVIATSEASFALPEALFGLHPAMVMPVLERRVAPAKLRALALRGASIDATAAERLGLVDEVVEPGALERAAGRAVRSFGRARPRAVRHLKSRTEDHALLCSDIEVGREETAAALRDPEVRARIRRYVEEAEAPWSSLQ
jgi:enoyl-CoA hydratase/carnithine racemase